MRGLPLPGWCLGQERAGDGQVDKAGASGLYIYSCLLKHPSSGMLGQTAVRECLSHMACLGRHDAYTEPNCVRS